MEPVLIQQKIHEIRGQKVLLDFDLAILYEVETKVFNQAIKRNLDNFPEDFMFRISKEEWEEIAKKQAENEPVNSNPMWSQIVTTSQKYRRIGYLPLAFTEHGVTMLASVLKSPKARKMNIAIVRTFIALRKFTTNNNEIIFQLSELKERIAEHDIQLSQIYDTIENLLDRKEEEQKWKDRPKIGFIQADK